MKYLQWQNGKKVLFSKFQRTIMEKLEQSLKIQRHHRVQHTIPVQDSLTIGIDIGKGIFFVGQCYLL